MVTTSSLLGHVKTIELQLQILKAQIRSLAAEAQPPAAPREIKSFADLRGIFAGGVQATEEDIEAAEYRFGWEDDDAA